MHKLAIVPIILSVTTYSYAACNVQIKRSAPDSRYESNNNGSEVRDKKTGLIWMRCSLGQSWNGTACTNTATTYDWGSALQSAKAIGGGWRLPNIKELDSLIEQACYNPSINESIFPNTVSEAYWSSSPVTDNGVNHAWFVSFGDEKNHFGGLAGGYLSNGSKEDGGRLFVRLVRSL